MLECYAMMVSKQKADLEAALAKLHEVGILSLVPFSLLPSKQSDVRSFQVVKTNAKLVLAFFVLKTGRIPHNLPDSTVLKTTRSQDSCRFLASADPITGCVRSDPERNRWFRSGG